MLDVIKVADDALPVAQELLGAESIERQKLSSTRLLAPIPRPPQIRDFSVFPQHLIGAPRGMARLANRLAGGPPSAEVPPGPLPEVYRNQPVFYFSNRFNVVGPDAEIRWPSYSEHLDFELEVAMVIKDEVIDVSRHTASDHIFGYMIYNDFSARDAQYHEMRGMLGPAKGKSFDTGNAFGPWIVTADELTDPAQLSVEARVNGEKWCSGTTYGMLHSFEAMIECASRSETLYPGEIFGSGTIGGCCGLEMDRYLSPGQTIELDIAGIGVLRNHVGGR